MEVVFEDNHLIAVNKRAGELVQGDDTGDEPLSDRLAIYLKKKYKKPGNVFVGVIHRLDRPVSGVVLFAKTSKALTRMNKLFSKREVKKVYYAVVQKRPSKEQATLEHFLVKNSDTNTVKAYSKDTKDAVKAKLSYKLKSVIGTNALLEVLPYTGRPHQIRVQLAWMGCSIVGDLKYGAKKANPDKSICLHAGALEFVHPVKQESVIIRAPLHIPELWPITF